MPEIGLVPASSAEGATVPSLSGWTVSVKRNIDLQGHVTTAGSAALCGAQPADADADIVTRIKRAGCGDLTLSRMHELAFGVTGINEFEGTPRNPNNPNLVPGGSSSGSAVDVATGVARIGLGTDTGGSVRIPAAFCGVYGLKLPHDRTLLHGILPLAPTLDHVGILANSLDDITTATRCITALDDVAERRSRFLRWPNSSAEPFVRRVFSQVLIALGRSGYPCAPIAVESLPSAEHTREVTNTIMFREAYLGLTRLRGLEMCRIGADVRRRLDAGSRIDDNAYNAALASRVSIEATARALLATDGVIIEPTVGVLPPPLHPRPGPSTSARLVLNTRLANAAGIPAITIPVATGNGPIGIQCTGTTLGGVLHAARILAAVLRPSSSQRALS